MITKIKNGIPLLQFSNLAGLPDLLHFVTTRQGGISTGYFRSFNLGFNSGDKPENVTVNRNILCKTLNIGSDQIIFPKQIHSAVVSLFTQEYIDTDEQGKKRFLSDSDAVITNLPGICLAVKTADCVPVLLFDKKYKVIAAVHAGWRGTLKGIAMKTVKSMISAFNTDPANIFAGIGPSISLRVYEVGQEVWSQFDKRYLEPDQKNPNNKYFLNLWKANHDQLTQAGISPDHIELAGLCTYSNPETFFSARRDGPKTGRIATGIMLL